MKLHTLTLSTGELKVFSELLERAGDEMANHGCNDFSLSGDAGCTPEEAEQFLTIINETLTPDCTEDPCVGDCQMDWLLLALLKRKIKDLL